jgi:hypothetical protein
MPHYPALLSISAHDVEMSSTNPIEAAVEFEGSEGGGYMATLGMYHEIHCLVRMLFSSISVGAFNHGYLN